MNKPAYPPPRNGPPCTNRAGRSRGYTLIELMIVVTVLGILTALAVPSYLNYVTESARSDAMIGLTTMAARQELFFSNNGQYALTVAQLGYPPPNPPDPSLGINQIWSEDKEQHYRISTLSCTPPRNDCFELAAEAWHGVTLKDTECARFELDSFGRRRAKDSGSVATDDCWN